MFTGTLDELRGNGQGTLTGDYLRGHKVIPLPTSRRTPDWDKSIALTGAYINNLKHIDVQFPLGLFICVTGVSGSGKSSLVEDTLVPAFLHCLHSDGTVPSMFDDNGGYGADDAGRGSDAPRVESKRGFERVRNVVLVDQSPVGLSQRSNPASYTKVFSQIRDILASTPQAKMNGYRPGFFPSMWRAGAAKNAAAMAPLRLTCSFWPTCTCPAKPAKVPVLVRRRCALSTMVRTYTTF